MVLGSICVHGITLPVSRFSNRALTFTRTRSLGTKSMIRSGQNTPALRPSTPDHTMDTIDTTRADHLPDNLFTGPIKSILPVAHRSQQIAFQDISRPTTIRSGTTTPDNLASGTPPIPPKAETFHDHNSMPSRQIGN